MITREQAIRCNEFHAEGNGLCHETIGPRGGRTVKQEVWRRNGATQTWKRDPARFRTPVKHGMYRYADLTEANAVYVHAAEDCPLVHAYAARAESAYIASIDGLPTITG